MLHSFASVVSSLLRVHPTFVRHLQWLTLMAGVALVASDLIEVPAHLEGYSFSLLRLERPREPVLPIALLQYLRQT